MNAPPRRSLNATASFTSAPAFAPIGQGKLGAACAQYEIDLPSGAQSGALNTGDLLHFSLEADEEARLTLRARTPHRRGRRGRAEN